MNFEGEDDAVLQTLAASAADAGTKAQAAHILTSAAA